MQTIGDATYSPEDNKLRLYPDARLDEDTYQKVKAAGFRWAPKQELFVAPAWTPAREDLLLELCGDIGDEDTSLVERQEERAERFSEYSDNRRADAVSARDAVSAIADNIPLGQPILVGHHSEKHARRDAQKIENGMRRAVRMWKTSEYWIGRAAGAIAHAKHKLRPDVRARRIKKLEADRRRMVRAYTPKRPDETILQERGYCPVCSEFGCKDHPEAKERVPHVYCGASRGGSWVTVASLPRIEKSYARSIAHVDLRLTYERAMLGSEGKGHLLDKPRRPKAPPLLNYRAPDGIEIRQRWGCENETLAQVEMTRAEFKKAYAGFRSDYKGTRVSADGSHRVRYARTAGAGVTGVWSAIFLSDSKTHPRPRVA